MLITFLAGLGAGVLVEHLQPRVTELLWRRLSEADMPGPDDRRLITFGAALIGAALLLWLMGTDAKAAPLVAGALVGHFQGQIRALLTARRR